MIGKAGVGYWIIDVYMHVVSWRVFELSMSRLEGVRPAIVLPRDRIYMAVFFILYVSNLDSHTLFIIQSTQTLA